MLTDLQKSSLRANIILPILAIFGVILRFLVLFRAEAGIRACELIILLALVSQNTRYQFPVTLT